MEHLRYAIDLKHHLPEDAIPNIKLKTNQPDVTMRLIETKRSIINTGFTRELK
jgi:hypothetical protein